MYSVTKGQTRIRHKMADTTYYTRVIEFMYVYYRFNNCWNINVKRDQQISNHPHIHKLTTYEWYYHH